MTIVFVYGTLRRNEGNDHYLRASEFIGEATSIDNGFVLRGRGPVPYLSRPGETPRSGKVKGEIFVVSDEHLPAIDRLEGHPQWYRREEHDFTLENGNVVTAWVYLIPWQEQMAREIQVFHVPADGVIEHPHFG